MSEVPLDRTLYPEPVCLEGGLGQEIWGSGSGIKGALNLRLSMNKGWMKGGWRITQRILRLRIVPFDTVLDLRRTTSQNWEAVPRRARI